MGLEVKDGVIAGDVHTGDVHHHHHHASPQPQLIAQPQTPPIVIVQKSGPSSAAPIVGALCAIIGTINALFAIPIFSEMSETSIIESEAALLSIGGSAFSLIAIIGGGVMIALYRRGGIYLIWCGFVITIFLDLIAFNLQGGVALEEFYGGRSMTIANMIFSLICGLIVAIPLLIPNNGMK